MGQDFTPLRLEGGRFETSGVGDVGFPLEAVVELARYERLLVQVARALWKADHPERQRAPKRFDESLRLRLTGVRSGSVIPVMQLRSGSADSRLFDPDQWVQRSQDEIAAAIEAVVEEQPLPRTFPTLAVSTLASFGSSLQSDEKFVLPRSTGHSVCYDQKARRHLVRIISSEDIKIDGKLVGRVSGAEALRRKFWFVDSGGRRVDGHFQAKTLFDELVAVAGDPEGAPFVRLYCRYTTDAHGQLSEIEDVREVETIVEHDDPHGARLGELLKLAEGWHDGQGVALDVSAVEWARDFVAETDDGLSADLRLFPTLDGGVLVEHQIESRRWSLEIDPDGDATVTVTTADGGVVEESPRDIAEAIEGLMRFAA